MTHLDAPLEAFLRRHLGRIDLIQPVGTAGAAFRIEGAAGPAYLKAHRQPGKHRRERRAYEDWAPHLAGLTPPLLVASDDPPALLLGALEGDPVDPGGPAAASLFAQAGRFARTLHGLPEPDGDSMCPREAIQARAEAWARRARRLAPRLAERVRGRVLDVAPVAQGWLRVPCHRDFEPRNWVAVPRREGPRLAVLDFEHSRLDVWLADVVRLAALFWPGAPALEVAFWNGYGRTPTADEAEVLAALVELEAAATLTWGMAHHDETFVRRGRVALEHLGLGRAL